MDLPADYPKEFGPGVRAYLARLDEADAFVVVTPEYNHSFPAALKQAIDLSRREWQAKPVAFVSYGQPVDAAGVSAAAKKMLDQLAWWAAALRTARADHPYAA